MGKIKKCSSEHIQEAFEMRYAQETIFSQTIVRRASQGRP